MNLLTKHGHMALLSDLTFEETLQAADLLAPILDGGPRMTAAMAYLIGIKQGVHDERARRKAQQAAAIFEVKRTPSVTMEEGTSAV